MNKEVTVYCVGCGKECHMPCHNVPETMISAVKAVPKNNRAKAYFGEMSYIRIVCDNCANLLISNVPKNTRPSFLALFNGIANECAELNTNNMETDESSEKDNKQSQSVPRKKRKADDSVDNDSTIMDVKRLLEKCFVKINNVENKSNEVHSIVSGNKEKLATLVKSESELKTSISKKFTSTEKIMKSLETSVESNGCKLDTISAKLDTNKVNIDDGMQKGFNKLFDMTEKMFSPATPKSINRGGMYGRGASIRRTAMGNSARNFDHDTPTTSKQGPNIPTESGSATDDNLFGPAVPRKIDFNSGDNQNGNNGPRQEFRHEDAVYIRYVDPSITPDKMLNIMMRNETIKANINEKPEMVEVTRLVKKRWTEDEIAKRRYGISYRIGGAPEIFELLKEKTLWANHWEIRLWDKDFNKTEQNFQHQQQRAPRV